MWLHIAWKTKWKDGRRTQRWKGKEEGRGRSEPSARFQRQPQRWPSLPVNALGPSPVTDRPVPIAKMVHTSLTKYLGSDSPWLLLFSSAFLILQVWAWFRMSLVGKGPPLFSEGHGHLPPPPPCLPAPALAPPVPSHQAYGKGSLLVSNLSLEFRHQGPRLPSQAGALASRPRSPRHPALPRFRATSWHPCAKPKLCLCLEKCRSESQMCQPYYHHQQTS